MKFKRVLLVFLALIMIIVSSAACEPVETGNPGGGQTSAENQSSSAAAETQTDETTSEQTISEQNESEVINCKYLMPGGPSPDNDLVVEKVNEKLLSDCNMTVETVFIEWDVWQQQINLKLATNEEFDLFHVMQTEVPTSFSHYYAMGGLSDLTDALETEGNAIKANIPEDIMNAGKIDGRQYTIPAFWIELAVEQTITIRKDLFEKYAGGIPRTPDEILSMFKLVQAGWKADELGTSSDIYFPFVSVPLGNPLTLHTTALHPAYDRYPFMVHDQLVFISLDGTVESWLETEEFKRDCEWTNKAYIEGLIDQDVLTNTQEIMTQNVYSPQNFALFFGTGAGDIKSMQTRFPDATENSIDSYRLNPEKPAVRPWAIKNANSVPAASEHPEGAVRFLNWLYSEQANYDLWMYGIEGTHFVATAEKEKESLTVDWSAPGAYWQSDWMMGNLNFMRVEVGSFKSEVDLKYYLDPTAVNSLAAGFVFDPTPVQTKYADVLNAYSEVIVPMYYGVQDYATHFDDAISKLKLAGLDDVLTEYKNQLFAYFDENNIPYKKS